MINDYIGILQQPRETFTKILKRKMHLQDSAILLLWTVLVLTALSVLVEWKVRGTLPLDSTGFVSLVVLGTIGTFLQTGLAVAIIRFIAKLVKGKGTYAENMSLFAFVVPLTTLLSIIVSLIPVVGGLLVMVVWIYSLYLYIVATSVANKIGMKDAAIAVLAPLAILILLIILLLGPLILIGLAASSMNGFNAMP